MKEALRFAVAALCVSFGASPAPAQVPYNEGPVARIVLLRVSPVHNAAVMADLTFPVSPEQGTQGGSCTVSFLAKGLPFH